MILCFIKTFCCYYPHQTCGGGGGNITNTKHEHYNNDNDDSITHKPSSFVNLDEETVSPYHSISTSSSSSDDEYKNDTKYDWYNVNMNDNQYNDGIVQHYLKIITTLEEKYLGIYDGNDVLDENVDRHVYLVTMKKSYETAIDKCQNDERLAVITRYEYKKDYYMKHLDDTHKIERDELLTKGRNAIDLSDKKMYYVEALKMAYSMRTINNIKKEWIIIVKGS